MGVALKVPRLLGPKNKQNKAGGPYYVIQWPRKYKVKRLVSMKGWDLCCVWTMPLPTRFS